MRGIVAIGVLGVMIASAGADAAVVCVKKRGGVVVREDVCKPKETVADAVALGIGGARREAAFRSAPAHGASLPTSTPNAAISRAAGLPSSISKTSRPDCAVSAKATR